MRLFEMKDWVLSVREECWGLSPFKKILKRDKSRDKAMALKEMLFIYYYSDIKSDYSIITNELIKTEEIKKDVGLPENWKIDSVMQEAIEFYESRSITVIGKLYKNALKAANDVSEYLTLTDVLLAERDNSGKPVNTITTITGGIKKIKEIMQDLKVAEKEVVKEQQELEGRMKGSKTMSIFEEGLNLE